MDGLFTYVQEFRMTTFRKVGLAVLGLTVIVGIPLAVHNLPRYEKKPAELADQPRIPPAVTEGGSNTPARLDPVPTRGQAELVVNHYDTTGWDNPLTLTYNGFMVSSPKTIMLAEAVGDHAGGALPNDKMVHRVEGVLFRPSTIIPVLATPHGQGFIGNDLMATNNGYCGLVVTRRIKDDDAEKTRAVVVMYSPTTPKTELELYDIAFRAAEHEHRRLGSSMTGPSAAVRTTKLKNNEGPILPNPKERNEGPVDPNPRERREKNDIIIDPNGADL